MAVGTSSRAAQSRIFLLLPLLWPAALACSDGPSGPGRDDMTPMPSPEGSAMPTAPPSDMPRVTPTPNPSTGVCDVPGRYLAPERPGAGEGGCFFLPPVGDFTPRVEWQWSGSQTLPDSHQVISLPVVIDVNADDVPDVLVATYGLASFLDGAVLRALSGDDGRELFTVTDPTGRLSPQSGLAAGDIDGDGNPEIVGIGVPNDYPAEDEFLPVGTRVVAFEHDGTVKWQSTEEVLAGWGAPTLADLDEDGTPEVIVGSTVLDNTGQIRWRGAGGNGGIVRGEGAAARSHMGSLSTVVNLDVTGTPELIAGNTVYRSDGSILWQRDDLPDGLAAVANLDCDPPGEVVLVGQNQLVLLDNDGSTICGPVNLPGGPDNNRGGAPTVADFDGDGQVEIATAGSSQYTVFNLDCSVLWSAQTQDVSSNVSSSSVFDFEGDGSAEVVYNDERKLRIYRGRDGEVLFEMDNPSDTTFEYPLIVDVDADFNAEIVVVTNDRDNVNDPGSRGVKVLGDAADNWVSTRRIWNQHSYHVTNVFPDGALPRRAQVNWELYNNFRQNVPAEGNPAFGAPDLVLAEPFEPPRLVSSFCPEEMSFRVRLINEGEVDVPAGIPVSFYFVPEGSDERTLAGTVRSTQALPPGNGQDLDFKWLDPYLGGDFDVVIVADDDGTGTSEHNECREENNELRYERLICSRPG